MSELLRLKVSRTLQTFLSGTLIMATAGCSVFGIQSVKEPSFRTILEEDEYSIREYDEYVIVSTLVGGNLDAAGNKAFKRLFAYISGANSSKTKITMTAPVLAGVGDGSFQAPLDTTSDQSRRKKIRGEKIAMTAPVIAEKQNNLWKFSFVLPAKYKLDDAPIPTSSNLELSKVEKQKVAVKRYSGSWNEKNRQVQSKKLLDWVKDNKLVATSGVVSAGYNPPWTLPFLKRNEVMVSIK